MAVKSGKNGTITVDGAEATPCTDWTMAILANNDNYGANDTGGWKKRVAGTMDTNGSFNLKDVPAVLGSYIGGDSSVDLVAYTDSEILTQTVVIDSITPVVDMNTGVIVTYAVAFSGNGALVLTTGSAV